MNPGKWGWNKGVKVDFSTEIIVQPTLKLCTSDDYDSVVGYDSRGV